MEPEILMTISLRFPQMDRPALAIHLKDLLETAVAVGGVTTHISFQPYDPDEGGDD